MTLHSLDKARLKQPKATGLAKSSVAEQLILVNQLLLILNTMVKRLIEIEERK